MVYQMLKSRIGSCLQNIFIPDPVPIIGKNGIEMIIMIFNVCLFNNKIK